MTHPFPDAYRFQCYRDAYRLGLSGEAVREYYEREQRLAELDSLMEYMGLSAEESAEYSRLCAESEAPYRREATLPSPPLPLPS